MDPYDALAELYDEWVVTVLEDVPFYVELAADLGDQLGRTMHVVELGAGSGRISVPLAQCDHHVTAIDLAGVQLARLQAKADAEGISGSIETIEADMRSVGALLPDGSADLVLAPFRSLLHIPPADRDALCAAVFALLAPGGSFAFDVFHPNADIADASDDQWLLRRRLPDDDGAGTWAIWERARFDIAAETLDLTVRCDHFTSDRPGPPAEQRSALLELHTPSAHAWRQSLDGAGFQLDSVHGWFDGTPFDPSCEDSVWVCHRPR